MRSIHLQSVDSTMDEAFRRWQESPEPVAVRADTQTAGQGRNGHAWESPAGGAWLTIAWPVTGELSDYGILPLVAGLAVFRTLRSLYGIVSCIKWPNDILVDDRKLAGILCRMEAGGDPVVLIGIGVNANFLPDVIRDVSGPGVTTLQELLDRPVDIAELCMVLGENISTILQGMRRESVVALIGEVRQELAWVGSAVTVRNGQGEELSGVLDGIDDSGGLLLRTGSGVQVFHSVESLRLSSQG